VLSVSALEAAVVCTKYLPYDPSSTSSAREHQFDVWLWQPAGEMQTRHPECSMAGTDSPLLTRKDGRLGGVEYHVGALSSSHIHEARLARHASLWFSHPCTITRDGVREKRLKGSDCVLSQLHECTRGCEHRFDHGFMQQVDPSVEHSTSAVPLISSPMSSMLGGSEGWPTRHQHWESTARLSRAAIPRRLRNSLPCIMLHDQQRVNSLGDDAVLHPH
jgi:hypothetical protein